MDPPIPPTPKHPPNPLSSPRRDPAASTVRRNPPRRARLQALPSASPLLVSAPIPSAVADPRDPLPTPLEEAPAESIRVYLRIRPLGLDARSARQNVPKDRVPRGRGPRYAKPNAIAKKKKNEPCLVVNDSSTVTLVVPPSVLDPKREKTEVFGGFSHVFPPDSTQNEVYERVMRPLVREFMGGKSGLLAAMGPTGSGKTYTVFGSPRNPGLVTLMLQEIFSITSAEGSHNQSRYYFSIFEICCERGKGERIVDLSPSGSEVFFQQSTIRGLEEVMVSSIVDAECLIARGLLKRATAITNANNQSSRSQCVINIRHAPETKDGEHGVVSGAALTIIDLAGAERERKTGNQGAKLIESGFINNTSMVFGLCLRSLFEHQKNPKKQLTKHFQNSLLTKYLRDYLEGKKRFTLILTAKYGEVDYPETSYLLRQASPYMQIKFHGADEFENLACQKRPCLHSRLQVTKRRNCGSSDCLLDDVGKRPQDPVAQSDKGEVAESCETIENMQISFSSKSISSKDEVLPGEFCFELQRLKRSEQILFGFTRALWSVLKRYKQKLEASENEVRGLKELLVKESSHALSLEKELQNLQLQCSNSECSSHEASLTSKGEKQYECYPVMTPSSLCGERVLKARDDVEDAVDILVAKSLSDKQEEIFTSSEDSRVENVAENWLMASLSGECAVGIKSDSSVSTAVDKIQCPYSAKDDPHALLDGMEKSCSKLHIASIGHGEKIIESSLKTLPPNDVDTNTAKPAKLRRQLMPASAMLLKEVKGIDVEMENLKMNVVEKTLPKITQRSRGSMALLQILQNGS